MDSQACITLRQGRDRIRGCSSFFSRRLAGHHGQEAAILAGKAIRGVALGVVLTAFIQSFIGGVRLAVTGIPAASLLMALMFILCLAQLGPRS